MTPEESELLAIVGRELYRRAVGPGPLYERMTNPRPGDLVVEVGEWPVFDPDTIGRLTETSGGRWGDAADRYVVEPLYAPGHPRTWVGASFVALPDRRGWLDDQPPGG